MKQIEKNHQAYEKLYELQEQYNLHTNITRINSKEEYYLKHIQDSLLVIPFLNNETSIIDVGTGAGYPGVPLAIELPHVNVILNDSVAKKTKYLNQVKEALGLNNVEIITERAEALGRDEKYREALDAGIARAVAETRVLLEYLSPLVKVGGRIYIMKGKDADVEVLSAKRAAKELGLKAIDIKKYMLGDMHRALIIYEKIATIPKKYPRALGVPGKNPL